MDLTQEKRADELFRLLNQHAPFIASSIRDAWIAGRRTLSLEEVADLIEQGRLDEAVGLIMESANPVFQEQAEESLRGAFLAAASWAWDKDRPKSAKVFRVVFDQLNEDTVAAMRRNELRMVQQVQSETRDGLRAMMEYALEQGMGPKNIARFLKEEPGFGLTRSQEDTVQRYRKFLTTVHEKKAIKQMGLGLKRSLDVDENGKPVDGINLWRTRDLRFDRAIERAMRDNKPLTEMQLNTQVGRYRERYIKLRSETIARTEMIEAGARGTREAWRAMVKAGVLSDKVRRFWYTSHTERVCPYCKKMPALNAEGRGLDEPFIGPDGGLIDGSPAHPGCACVIFVKSDA